MDQPESDSSEISLWLDRLASGDLEARDRIIEITSGRLRILASRMLSRFPSVRRWEDTDDVFQNAVMRLHRPLTKPYERPRHDADVNSPWRSPVVATGRRCVTLKLTRDPWHDNRGPLPTPAEYTVRLAPATLAK